MICHRIPSPSNSLPALTSASLGMHTAQSQALDRLYVTEFKRFITGKIVSSPNWRNEEREAKWGQEQSMDAETESQTERAKARLELFPGHSERGDLGEVFCGFPVSGL
jgi:hypothetical protein